MARPLDTQSQSRTVASRAEAQTLLIDSRVWVPQNSGLPALLALVPGHGRALVEVRRTDFDVHHSVQLGLGDLLTLAPQFYMAFLASHNDLGQHPNVQEVCAVRPPNAP